MERTCDGGGSSHSSVAWRQHGRLPYAHSSQAECGALASLWLSPRMTWHQNPAWQPSPRGYGNLVGASVVTYKSRFVGARLRLHKLVGTPLNWRHLDRKGTRLNSSHLG